VRTVTSVVIQQSLSAMSKAPIMQIPRIPVLCAYASEGLVVSLVEHLSAVERHPSTRDHALLPMLNGNHQPQKIITCRTLWLSRFFIELVLFGENGRVSDLV
jgi:hypothetical protein